MSVESLMVGTVFSGFAIVCICLAVEAIRKDDFASFAAAALVGGFCFTVPGAF